MAAPANHRSKSRPRAGFPDAGMPELHPIGTGRAIQHRTHSTERGEALSETSGSRQAKQRKDDTNLRVGGLSLTAPTMAIAGRRNEPPGCLSLRKFGAETFGYLWILLVRNARQGEAAIAERRNAVARAQKQRARPRRRQINQRKKNSKEHQDDHRKGDTHHFRRTPGFTRPSGQFLRSGQVLRRAARESWD